MEHYDDNTLRQYLLSGLPEGEQWEALDELSIVDDEFAALLEAVENELIDAYIHGELDGRELAQFESQYLASPHQREKVRFAQAFQSFAEKKLQANAAGTAAAVAGTLVQESRVAKPELVRQVVAQSVPWWRPVLTLFTVPRLTLQWGFAAVAVLMLMVGGWMVLDLRSQVDQAQAERAALRQREKELQAQLEQQHSTGSETERELGRVREQLARLEQERALEQQRAKLQPPSWPTIPKIVSFDLAAGGARRDPSSNEQISTITVPPGTDYVSLQLDLPPNDYSTYRAELWPSGKKQSVWRSEKLKARNREIGKVIDASIPADRLKSQEYVLKVTPSGVSEKLADYQFRVQKQ